MIGIVFVCGFTGKNTWGDAANITVSSYSNQRASSASQEEEMLNTSENVQHLQAENKGFGCNLQHMQRDKTRHSQSDIDDPASCNFFSYLVVLNK